MIVCSTDAAQDPVCSRVMATLQSLKEPAHGLVLLSSEIIGRAPSCTVRIDHPRVSSVHACIEWQRAGWVVRDLGSRNGTFVDAYRLKAGEDVPLVPGAVVRLADVATWRLVDDNPPTVVAIAIEPAPQPLHADPPDAGALRREAVPAEAGLLALPGDVQIPEVTIFRTALGTWIAEFADEQRQIIDGDTLHIAGKDYRLHLPDAVATTHGLHERDVTSPARLRWHFTVSRDEEHVALSICSAEQTCNVPPRAWLYTLLTLARLRVRDQRAADLPINAHGWIHQDELAHMLGHTINHLHTDIYRARRTLSKQGIEDLASVIERRPGSKLLRFGYQQIFIQTL